MDTDTIDLGEYAGQTYTLETYTLVYSVDRQLLSMHDMQSGLPFEPKAYSASHRLSVVGAWGGRLPLRVDCPLNSAESMTCMTGFSCRADDKVTVQSSCCWSVECRV